MSRLKKLKVEEEQAMVQKTVRIPSDLYKDIELLMLEAGIDSFNKAVVELFRLEIEEWKEEKKKQKNDSDSEDKKEVKKTTKKTTKSKPKKETKSKPNNDSKDESFSESIIDGKTE